MHRDRPVITENADELKQLLKEERHRQKQQRLHMLYLFAAEQATTRQAAAALLGVHRETVGRWLTIYAQGGRTALLDIYVAKGKTPALPPAVVSDLEHHLTQPAGFASYAAMRVWLLETHAVTVKLKTLQKFARRRFGTRAKVVRPTHQKKQSGTSPVQGNCG